MELKNMWKNVIDGIEPQVEKELEERMAAAAAAAAEEGEASLAPQKVTNMQISHRR